MKKEKTVLKQVCAWCGKPMGEIDGEGVQGTCHKCREKCSYKEREKFLARQRELHNRELSDEELEWLRSVSLPQRRSR